MLEYLDVRTHAGDDRVVLEGEQLTIGRSESNALAFPDDASLSRVHALMEKLPTGWALRDLSSHNGTVVNGRRIWSETILRSGDEIQVGAVSLTFNRSPSGQVERATVAGVGAPDLTRRERDVLMELCRPALSGQLFTEPASIKDISRKLFITEAAVKQHLGHLYDKFDIPAAESERRRVRLANEAVRRGAISLPELAAT